MLQILMNHRLVFLSSFCREVSQIKLSSGRDRHLVFAGELLIRKFRRAFSDREFIPWLRRRCFFTNPSFN